MIIIVFSLNTFTSNTSSHKIAQERVTEIMTNLT